MIPFIAPAAIPLPYGLNKLDLAISIIVTIPAVLGLRKGFLRSVFSLFGIIAGLLLATRYTSPLSDYFRFLNIDERVITIASFILIMAAVYSTLSFFAGKISDINLMTRTTDKLAGLAFGAVKGAIFVSLLLIASTKTFPLISADTLESSKLYPLLVNAAPDIYNFFSAIIPGANNFYDEFRKSVNTIIE